MKICFFDFITLAGGATKGSVHLLERLQNKNVEVHAINVYGNCHEYLEDLHNSNINYTVLINSDVKNTIGFKDNFFRRLLEILRQLPIFIFIFFKLFAVIYELKPTHIMVNNKKSLIFTFLFKYIFGFKIIYYYRIEASSRLLSLDLIFLLNNLVDHLFCHSKNVISNMANLGVTNKIIYLPNCIKLDEDLKNANEKKNNEFSIFLNAGRIVREKGYHTAIYALNELIKKNYNVVLKLPGLITDQEYYSELKDYVQKNKLDDCVIFCGWLNNVQQEIVHSDCMILPSYSEGFPRSVIEAMLLKIPVCATPVGGIPEAVIDNETGFLFEVNDHATLALRLEILINDTDLKAKLVEKAHQFALENFDESINTNIFINGLK